VHKSDEPSAPIRTAIKRRGVAIRSRCIARNETEIQRGVIRFVFRFRGQKSLGLKDFAPAATPHRFYHRPSGKAQKQKRGNERENRGDD